MIRTFYFLYFSLLAASMVRAQYMSPCDPQSKLSKAAESRWLGDMALVPYRKGKLWGYADPGGKVVIAPVYQEVGILEYGYMPVRGVKGWGVITPKGKVVLALKYTDVDIADKKYLRVQLGSKYGIFGTDGKQIIPIAYKDIWPEDHRGGFAAVTMDGQHIIEYTKQGKQTGKRQNEYARINKVEDYAAGPGVSLHSRGDGYGMRYKPGHGFDDRRHFVKGDSGHYAIQRADGSMATGYIFQNVYPSYKAGDFIQGVGIVYRDEKGATGRYSTAKRYWQLVDTAGRFLLSEEVEQLWRLGEEEEYIQLQKGYKVAVYFTAGKRISPWFDNYFKFDYKDSFVVANAQGGAPSQIMNHLGKSIYTTPALAHLEYAGTKRFILYSAYKDQLWLINEKGDTLSTQPYAYIKPFSYTGRALVATASHYGMIDGTGKEVIKPAYSALIECSRDWYWVCRNGENFFMNSKGKEFRAGK